MVRWAFTLAFVLLLAVNGNGCKSQSLLTETQAKDAVRSFEDDQTLVVMTFGLETEENPFTVSGTRQLFSVKEIAEPDTRTYWSVDATTGEVYSVLHGARIPTTDTETPFGSYTQTQCQSIAPQFAQDKYNDFGNSGFQLAASQWTGHGWGFGWRQYSSYGAVTPNIVNVDVSSTTGLVQSYGSSRFPVYAPQQAPSITSQQAVQLAAQSAGIATLDSNDTPQLNASRTTLFWRTNVVGEDSSNNCIDVAVDIDAYSGNPIGTYAPMIGGIMPKTKKALGAASGKPHKPAVSEKSTAKKPKPSYTDKKTKRVWQKAPEWLNGPTGPKGGMFYGPPAKSKARAKSGANQAKRREDEHR